MDILYAVISFRLPNRAYVRLGRHLVIHPLTV